MNTNKIIEALEKAKDQDAHFGKHVFYSAYYDAYCTIGWLCHEAGASELELLYGANTLDAIIEENYGITIDDSYIIYSLNDYEFKDWDDAIKYFKELSND